MKNIITIEIDGGKSAKTIADMEKALKKQNEELKKLEIGTDGFKKMQTQIKSSEKELNLLKNGVEKYTHSDRQRDIQLQKSNQTIDNNTQKIVKLKIENDNLAQVNKNLKKMYENGEISIREYTNRLAENTTKLTANKNEMSTLSNENKNLLKIQEAIPTSMNEISLQLENLRKQYKGMTEEERASPIGKEMKKNIDSLDAEIKDLDSSIGNNQRNVGNYAEAFGNVPGPVGQATNSIKGMGKSLMALLANPVVLVITAIVGVLALLYKSFTKTEEGGNKMNKLFSLIGGLISSVMKAIEPFASFLVNKLVKAFELVSKGIDLYLKGMAGILDFLGLDSMADGVRDVTQASKDLLKTTTNIANKEAELVKLRREQRKIQMQYQLDAEKLRQIRDDETVSMEKRYEANEKLGKLLSEQSSKELSIAQKELDLINLKIGLEGKTTELLDARAEAELQIIDIQERIAGQQSEQLVNINSLKREQLAKEKEAIDKVNEARQKQIEFEKNLLLLQLEERKIKGEEEIKIKEEQINKLWELDKKNLQQNSNEYILAEKEKNNKLLELENEKIELKKQKLEEDYQNSLKYLNLGFQEEELILLQSYANNEEYQGKRIESEEEYQEKLNAIKLASIISEIEMLKGQEDKKEELRQKELERDKFLAEEQVRINKEKTDKINEDKEKELEKFADMQKQAEQITQQFGQTAIDAMLEGKDVMKEMARATSIFILDLLEKQMIASVTSASVQSMAQPDSVATFGASGFIRAGILTGLIKAAFSGVKAIISKVPSAGSGMLIGGKPHSQGGTMINAEKGEVIINKRSSAMFMNELSEINKAGGGVPFMARGGVVAGNIASSSIALDFAKQDMQNRKLAEMMSNIRNVVSVEEINSKQNDLNKFNKLSIL